ncbi:MAG: phage holin [Oscillospiraceae bacterium]
MPQLKIILNRLKKPSVLLSIASQIVAILLLFNVNIDMNIVTGVITAITSIFVLLGIISDPTTQNKGYGDVFLKCEHCNKDAIYTVVDGRLVCSQCGTEYVPKDQDLT